MEKFSSKELAEICKEAVSEIAENGFLEKALTEKQREILRKIKESHKDGIWLEKKKDPRTQLLEFLIYSNISKSYFISSSLFCFSLSNSLIFW